MQTVVDDAVDDAATFELVCAIELEYIEHQKYIYTVNQKKTPMRTIVHNFVKFLPIFTIF